MPDLLISNPIAIVIAVGILLVLLVVSALLFQTTEGSPSLSCGCGLVVLVEIALIVFFIVRFIKWTWALT